MSLTWALAICACSRRSMTCADGSRHVAWVVVGMAPGGPRLLGEARFFRSASGDEAEMALRFGYEAIFADQTTDDLELGIENFLALPGPATGMKTIIFSADAMRRTRRYLGLTNPEEVAR